MDITKSNSTPDEVSFGQKFVKMKRHMSNRWKKRAESKEEEVINDLADVIQTFRGIVEEEEEENLLWVDRPPFDLTMSICIILNTVVVGLEVDQATPGNREWYWDLAQLTFCLIFIGEISFKVYYHGSIWIIQSIWNIVIFFVASLAFVDLLLQYFGVGGNVRIVSLFRVFGLVRMAKIIKRNRALEELRLVVQGLASSFETLIWAFILITMFLYIAGLLLTKHIGLNVEVYSEYKKLSGGWDHEEYFGTVGRSMYSLLQAMILDGWASKIARHTIANQWYMFAFWIIFLLLTTFGIMNIVVSVIVELMLTASANNENKVRLSEEKHRKEEMNCLKEIFLMSDEDGNNTLDLDEFVSACKIPAVQARMRQLNLPINEASKLFGAIDADESSSLTFDEFISGCMKLRGPAQSKEMLAIQAHADSLASKMDVLAHCLTESERMMGALDEVVTRIGKRFDTALIGSRRKIVRQVGGAAPMQPLPREQTGGDQAPLWVGNKPVLPPFPDMLR